MTQRGGILNRAGRCIWTLTFILALTGRGDRERALLGREAAPHLGFYCDRKKSSALRTTLRLIPGAGVTPAEGSVKPTAGFTFDQVILKMAARAPRIVESPVRTARDAFDANGAHPAGAPARASSPRGSRGDPCRFCARVAIVLRVSRKLYRGARRWGWCGPARVRSR